MELKISPYKKPEQICFNYEELKKIIIEKASLYESVVYTDEQIKSAKKDRANLNKFKKALNDERIKLENEYMTPFNEFKSQIKELIAIIDKPCTIIDNQIKVFEKEQKQKKCNSIIAFWEICKHPSWLSFDQIFEDKWLNASYSMITIENEIKSKLDNIEKDISILRELPDLTHESIEEYKRTLDVTTAITKGRRLAEISKKKDTQTSEDSQPKQWIKFQALLSEKDATELKNFFKFSKIEFLPL